MIFFFFSSRRRHTRSKRDWSSDVCSSDLADVVDVEVLELDSVACAASYVWSEYVVAGDGEGLDRRIPLIRDLPCWASMNPEDAWGTGLRVGCFDEPAVDGALVERLVIYRFCSAERQSCLLLIERGCSIEVEV